MFASVSYRRGNDALGNIFLGAESNKELLLLKKKIPSITLLMLSDLGLENCTVNGVGDKQRGKWQIKGTDSQEKKRGKAACWHQQRRTHNQCLMHFLRNRCVCKLLQSILAECNLSNEELTSTHSWINSLSTPEI